MQHKEEVQKYLLEKKEAFVDRGDDTSVDDNMQQPLRSPPSAAIGLRSPQQGSVPLARNGFGEEQPRSRMPPLVYFPVPGANSPRVGTHSPTTPGSPLRQGFGRS